MELSLRRGAYQGPPTVVADLEGTVVVSTHGQGTRELVARADPQSFRRTLELVLEGQRYLIVGSTGGVTVQPAPPSASSVGGSLGGTRFDDVASQVGLAFRHGAFRFGGVHGRDGDDGRRALLARLRQRRLARSVRRQLLRRCRHQPVRGTRRAPTERALPKRRRPLRGREPTGRRRSSVAGQRLRRGRPRPRRPHRPLRDDAGYNVPTDGYDALLWNDGDGTFTEGAREAGIDAPGWHSGAAVGDVNGDGTPDLFVTAYADPNVRVDPRPASRRTTFRSATCSTSTRGADDEGRSTFREVAKAAGIERKLVGHGLGAVFTDVDRDGRLDLYVANDTDPTSSTATSRRAAVQAASASVSRKWRSS